MTTARCGAIMPANGTVTLSLTSTPQLFDVP